MDCNNKPFLSIIVPVFNVEDYLEETICSILGQNFDNWEMITINDGSTDSSGKILDHFGKTDERIKVFHRKNHGLSATRNFGLKKAKGEYVYFLDSDDVIIDGLFNSLNKISLDNHFQIFIISGEYIDKESNPVTTPLPTIHPNFKIPHAGERVYVDLYRTGTYTPLVLSYFFRKNFLEENSLIFDEGYIHEDEAYIPTALCLADSVISTANIYYQHRKRPNSIMTVQKSEENIKGWTKAVSRLIKLMNRSELNDSTRRVIRIKAKSLMNNSLLLINKLNRDFNSSLNIENYISAEEMQYLGKLMKLKSKFPSIIKMQRYINSM
ncbi:MAG: glycosyltransferase [Balneolaceae bacterium]|nr:MAG: glycosyltransferase [Balneolaceae bacterium]